MDTSDSPGEAGTYHTTHDWGRDGSLSRTIVEAVAAVKDGDASDLNPLEAAVDSDALDQLMSSLRRSAAMDGEGRLEFTVDGVRVTVTSSGEVTARRQPAERAPGEMSTDSDFQDALARLIRAAEANGVAVDGGWACRDDSEYPEWGIEIYEVDSSR